MDQQEWNTAQAMPPEILAAITAAVTVFMEKRVRVLSARWIGGAKDDISPWVRQGRILLQNSHDVRARKKIFGQEPS
jgi:hypothetical protein